MSADYEIAVRTPQLATLKWIGVERFTIRVSEGVRVERGEVIGEFHDAPPAKNVTAQIISPLTGQVTFANKTCYMDLKEGELLIRIKSELPLATDGRQIGQDIFQNLQRYCDESLAKRQKEVSDEKVNAVAGVVIMSLIFGGGGLLFVSGGGTGILIGVFLLLLYIFGLRTVKQQLDSAKSRLSAYPGERVIKDALAASVSAHASSRGSEVTSQGDG
jgi:hypothetical protein